ncbi:MAG: hypothetical protein P4N59_07720 [Negativicutes bacterium]|nr:hypothetical protein [Negativicutes bacterium]
MSILRAMGETFGPGGPGFAVTLFVLVTAAGYAVRAALQARGSYRRARQVRGWARAGALASGAMYLVVWLYLAVRSAFGW